MQARKVVGANANEVLQLSKQRNSVSKRGKVALTARQVLLQQQEQEQEQRRQRLQPQHACSSEEEDAHAADRKSSSSGRSSVASDIASDSDIGDGDDDGHFFSEQQGGGPDSGQGEKGVAFRNAVFLLLNKTMLSTLDFLLLVRSAWRAQLAAMLVSSSFVNTTTCDTSFYCFHGKPGSQHSWHCAVL
eukprot:1147935-Pelagomonas_calceolata.AAC.6